MATMTPYRGSLQSQAGNSPGVMAISPSRNIAATFDAGSSNVYAVDTFTEADIGNVRIPGPTSSMVFPTAQPIGYAAIPTATVNGFTFVGAVDSLELTSGHSSPRLRSRMRKP